MPCGEEQSNYLMENSQKQHLFDFQVLIRQTFSSQVLQKMGECRSQQGSQGHILPAAHH